MNYRFATVRMTDRQAGRQAKPEAENGAENPRGKCIIRINSDAQLHELTRTSPPESENRSPHN